MQRPRSRRLLQTTANCMCLYLVTTLFKRFIFLCKLNPKGFVMLKLITLSTSGKTVA